MIALSVRNVRKTFGSVVALDGVSFEVRAGEFYGLLGPNGAGKTTLLRIVCGLLKADSGEVVFDGALRHHGARRLGVVPQEIALYDTLTAIRNLEIFGALQGLDRSLLRDRTRFVLELVGLDAHAYRRVKTFSGGMKRRLNLAVGLLHDPDLLLLDEPTVGVDTQSRTRIFALLRELHAQGKTIVYTTHYMEEAERLCARIGILDHGRLLAEGPLSDLLLQIQLPRLVRLLGVPENAPLPKVDAATLMREDEHVDCVPHAPGQLGRVVMQIEQSGLRYERMEVIGPNLETLFLQLTGRELRD